MEEEQRQEEKSKYTRKIEIPIYEPKNKMPHVLNLYDTQKRDELVAKIKASNAPEDIKTFLYSAAERHTKFNYSKVADFYAHSDLDIKKLFEDSALVIIDYDDAIKNGFISYQKYVDEDLDEFLDDLSDEDLIKNLNKANSKIEPKDKANIIMSRMF